MSKHNKVNKDHYVQGGRLTPDEMARERMAQARVAPQARGKESVTGKRAKHGQESTPRRTGRAG
jgi:hypothetical protein